MTDLITLTTQVPLETLREGLKKRMIVESPNVRVSEFFFDQGTSTKGHTHGATAVPGRRRTPRHLFPPVDSD